APARGLRLGPAPCHRAFIFRPPVPGGGSDLWAFARGPRGKSVFFAAELAESFFGPRIRTMRRLRPRRFVFYLGSRLSPRKTPRNSGWGVVMNVPVDRMERPR